MLLSDVLCFIMLVGAAVMFQTFLFEKNRFKSQPGYQHS